MSWAIQDSNQWKIPATGASTASRISRSMNGSPVFTARTASALTAPMPMKETTRVTPKPKVSASLPL